MEGFNSQDNHVVRTEVHPSGLLHDWDTELMRTVYPFELQAVGPDGCHMLWTFIDEHNRKASLGQLPT
jgi:hypothetical protein